MGCMSCMGCMTCKQVVSRLNGLKGVHGLHEPHGHTCSNSEHCALSFSTAVIASDSCMHKGQGLKSAGKSEGLAALFGCFGGL